LDSKCSIKTSEKITSITPTGGDNATLSFTGYAGYIYQNETNTDLAPVWETIGSPVEGIGSAIEFVITLGEVRRFYRVRSTLAP
jgi:hypothetical protein